MRFDSVGGASGDMILSALVDLGVAPEALQEQLAPLGLGPFRITAEPCSDRGLNGMRVSVVIPAAPQQAHRHLADICARITTSTLSDGVKDLSVRVFQRLAEAEAKIHNVAPDEVHFHEVGAVDTIVDVVGSCLALEILGVDRVVVGPLPCGCGTIQCAHGTLPNPGPATVEMLKGHPLTQTDETAELVTPTGAALLMEWKGLGRGQASGDRDQRSETRSQRSNSNGTVCGAEPASDQGQMANHPFRLARVGHGFGHFRLRGRPNLLRAMIMESAVAGEAGADECLVLECNLDDTVPELIGSLSQKLMAQGALDAFTTAVQMKKQRPGTLLTVLCRPADRDRLSDLMFRESTTFGIREHLTRRTMLDRRTVEVNTPYGAVRVKIGAWKGKDLTRSPEHDDCLRCAEIHGIAVRAVYESALRAV